ncbi:MAG: chemotaxis protein CheV [Thiotrichales bacterium]|jgi:two-component system chemotaxis response regulator CheV|nr:chemotaxis protein CheV [Thiotrichales bacterium]
MSDLLKTIDRRTKLVGMNRMELLLFTLHDQQRFGINVFKVREVIRTPEISPVPKSDPRVVGIADIRGTTMPIIDLPLALDLPPMSDNTGTLTIVTEFNSSIQGFLVGAVDKIVHLRWEDILPPPETLMNVNYLTGVTKVGNNLVEIIDVERVLQEVAGRSAADVSDELAQKGLSITQGKKFHVVGCDDSVVARAKLKAILDKLGVESSIYNNGRLALEALQRMAEQAEKGDALAVSKQVLMVVSDIEMPEMDGYTLTANIRKDPRLKDLYVVLNSSLSGGFNDTLTQKVGANKFLSKWHTDELANLIIERIRLKDAVAA